MEIHAIYLKMFFTVSIFSLLMANFSSCSNESYSPSISEITSATTSVEMARKMTIGWNLGNTLDAHGDWTDDEGVFHSDFKPYEDGSDTETVWSMPKTTEAMISDVKAKGFKTIRIPVSWHNHIKDANYTIDPDWMARVKEVVDWAYNKDMYVIINIHHDNLSQSQLEDNTNYGFALSYDKAIQNKSKTYISKVWTQIATTFASYDEKLVFEVLNEPRDINGEVTGNEWWTTDKNIVAVITEYEQAGIDSIRKVDGNKNRFLMVPGYAAAGSADAILNLYTMPKDSATDRLILSTHAYSPNNFALAENGSAEFTEAEKGDLDYIFGFLKRDYVDKGIGVVMGEASATDRNNTAARIEWATYYFSKAKEASIPIILWDNMVTVDYKGTLGSGENHGYYDRNNRTWFYPEIIQAMVDATY